MLIIAIFFLVTFFTLLFKNYIPIDSRKLVQITLLIALGCYFSWSWSLGRQTLAMKTWRVKVITQNQQMAQYPSLLHAFYRYIGILLPWIAVEIINNVQQEYRYNHNIPTRHYHMLMQLGWLVTALVFPWAWAIFHPEKLSFHDALARTRLVYEPKKPA
jgi:uncharacterized RDD family membrane protein YckC